jgi:ATP-dependent Lon protease
MNNNDDIKNKMKNEHKMKYLESQLRNRNNKFFLLQTYFTNMINNVVILRNYTILDNNSSSLKILEYLDDIKTIITSINKLFEKNSSSTDLEKKELILIDIDLQLYNLEDLILKNFYYISSSNFDDIEELFLEDDFHIQLNSSDEKVYDFIKDYLCPICVWSSKYHSDVKKDLVPINENKIIKISSIFDSLLNQSKPIIIGGNDNKSMPNFIKNISDMLNSKKVKERDNNFSITRCMNVLDNRDIMILSNPKCTSLYEENNGVLVYLKINSDFLVIQGYLKDDLLNLAKDNSFIKENMLKLKKYIHYDAYDISKEFRGSFIDNLNLRDIITLKKTELLNNIKKAYSDFNSLKNKPLVSIINEFLSTSKYRKIDILTYFMSDTEENKKIGYVLYEVLKQKDKSNLAETIYQSLHYNIRAQLDNTKKVIDEDNNKLKKIDLNDIPYDKRIQLMKTTDETKSKAMQKLKLIKSSIQGDSKAQNWLDGLLKLPFGIYRKNSIMDFKNNFIVKLNNKYNKKLVSDSMIERFMDKCEDEEMVSEWEKYKVDKKDYLGNIRNVLDKAVYGHKEAKLQLERIFAQWINGHSKGAILGLEGPPGTGKTSLAKKGLSKCLVDDNGEVRPFAFLPIGGSVNGSTLVGHNYTYVGSTWGRIADILMTSKCMNPIIFIDEIDKVSRTEHGKEIISILTHLTDLSQSDEFEDKYFSGIKLDLSKALIVFSYNDASLIDPILRDRITTIKTEALTIKDKLVVLKDYMLPEIFDEVGFGMNEIEFSDEVLTYIVNTYTYEAGVRKVKEKLYDIVRSLNLDKIYSKEFKVPHVVTKDYIKQLFINKPKVRIKKIGESPSVGLVNGLYATATGIGGLTIIQVMKFPSSKMLELNLTGKQGDVMKESVNYALKIAFGLLTKKQQQKIIDDANDKKAFGLHVHTPEAATPKDGPSAGAAMTIAIYSVLTNKKIKNTVAMTGEIDLCRNVTMIGGLYAKLEGAKAAGVTKALVPKDNEDDLLKMRREGISPECSTFEVVLVSTIEDVIKHVF